MPKAQKPPRALTLREPVTPRDVLTWARRAGWHGDTLHRLGVLAIANECNAARKRAESQQRRRTVDDIYKVRDLTHRARNLSQSLKTVIETLIDEMENWTEWEQHTGGMAELKTFLVGFEHEWNKVRPLVRAVRDRGGQPVAWARFVRDLDEHLEPSLASKAATPESPLVAFITLAVEAVFGPHPRKAAGDDRSEAIAKLINRHRT